MELKFDTITKQIGKIGLNFQSFTVLYYCAKDVKTVSTFPGYDSLISNGFIYKDGSVTEKGVEALKCCDDLIKTKETKKPEDIIGRDSDIYITEYRKIFPSIKLGSGKYARCSEVDLKKAFVWFFKTYKYSWNEILEATRNYINAEAKKDFKYTKTSVYFIRKNDTSELAQWIENTKEQSTQIKQQPVFKTKVI